MTTSVCKISIETPICATLWATAPNTLTVGEDTKIYIDENQGKFLITGARNFREANPDVFEFSDVIGCQLDVQEHQTEIKTKDAEGHTQSLNPR